MTTNKILIVDDHPLFRGALNQALTASIDGAEVIELASLDALTCALNTGQQADLILLDLTMPGVQGLSGLLFLRAQFPQIPVMIVSAKEDASTIRRCIEFGASGYIPKSKPVEQIRNAIRLVLGGEIWTPPEIDLDAVSPTEDGDLVQRLSNLTPQQLRVLMMLGEGLLNKQIAFNLKVSEATIKAHVSAILQKLGVDSRTQAVIAVNRIDSGDWQQLVRQ